MFKKKSENDAPKVFSYATGIQEKNPLTAVPADPYLFKLEDTNGSELDEAWVKRQCDSIPLETLDATSGAYLDHEIVSAMSRALGQLRKRRKGSKGHIEIITETEERESKVADDISRVIDDLLTKLEAAKRRTATLQAG